MDKTGFINMYYPIAKIASEKYDINPVVILAQAAHESAWGTSYSAKNRFNFFGITAIGSPNEYWDGKKSQSSASGLWFRIYKNAQDSFSDFARLISAKYKTAAKVSNDTAAYAHAIAYSPYITELVGDNRPAYEKAVKDNSEFIKKVLGPTLLRDEEAREKKNA
jgi:peptidoglycan hydrolase FlgJ